MPQTVAEGLDFFRWLFLQWRKVEDATTDQQVRAITPQQPGPTGAQAFEEAIAFQRARTVSIPSNAFDAGAAAAFSRPTLPAPDSSDVANLALTRTFQPPFRPFVPPQIIQDTHANKANYPPDVYANGTLYYETDRLVYYINQGAPGSQKWVYTVGTFECLQANLPNDLGPNDSNFLANVFDYGHLLIWSGVAWTWGPGDAGSGMLQLFEADPTGAGWHLYDGTSGVPFLKADGTLGTVNLPNLSGSAPTKCYLKTSDTTGGPTSPVAPTFTGGSSTPAGTISAPTFSGTPAVLTGTNSTPTFSGSALGTHTHDSPVGFVSVTQGFVTADFGSGGTHTRSVDFTVAASAGSAAVQKTSAASAGTPVGTVSAPTLTMDSYTPAGTNSTPIFTGTPSSVSGTIGTNGEPESLTRRAWFRQ